MGKRSRYRDALDPEMGRWGQKYRRFPGVAECARLIRAGKARGTWAEMIASELAENAAACLPELMETFRTDPCYNVRLYVMMALEMAHLPESVPFLAEVLRQEDERLKALAESALVAINTAEARTVLWNLKHDSKGKLFEASSE